MMATGFLYGHPDAQDHLADGSAPGRTLHGRIVEPGHGRTTGRTVFEDGTPGMKALIIVRNDEELDLIVDALCGMAKS